MTSRRTWSLRVTTLVEHKHGSSNGAALKLKLSTNAAVRLRHTGLQCSRITEQVWNITVPLDQSMRALSHIASALPSSRLVSSPGGGSPAIPTPQMSYRKKHNNRRTQVALPLMCWSPGAEPSNRLVSLQSPLIPYTCPRSQAISWIAAIAPRKGMHKLHKHYIHTCNIKCSEGP